MLLSAPKGKSNDFQKAVKSISNMITTCCSTSNLKAVEVTPRVGYESRFTLRGADKTGIVLKVTNLLSKHRLNIDDLKTFEDDSAPTVE